MAEFNMDKMAKSVAEKALDDYVYQGKTIREWIAIIAKNVWIPVSAGLPENKNLVLVTAYWHETYQVMVGSYWGNGIWWCAPWNNTSREHLKVLNAVAWMPLPEPYKGESEESE